MLLQREFYFQPPPTPRTRKNTSQTALQKNRERYGGAFATLKEKSRAYRRSHFSEPMDSPDGNTQQKRRAYYSPFLLVSQQMRKTNNFTLFFMPNNRTNDNLILKIKKMQLRCNHRSIVYEVLYRKRRQKSGGD